MGRYKLSALVGAAFLAIPLAAGAADYPQPPPYTPPVEIGGNWYLKGYIGMAAQHFAGLDHPDFATPATFEWLDPGQFDGVPLFGIGIGWRHSEHLRFDLTGEYRSKSAFSALDRYDSDTPSSNFGSDCTFSPSGDCGTNHYTGKKDEWLFLANAYYDFNPIHGIVPYVGMGVGAAYNTIYDFVDDNVITGGQGWAPTGHKLNLAWALHAGASLQVTNNLTLDLGYSFVRLGDAQTGPFQNVDLSLGCNASPPCVPMNFKGIYSHDVKLAVRWAFDQPSYYPPVVKY
jgi:opacity protein-like surface antigen